MCKSEHKMSSEELAGLLHMRTRGGAPKAKRGKGSYSRKEKNLKAERIKYGE